MTYIVEVYKFEHCDTDGFEEWKCFDNIEVALDYVNQITPHYQDYWKEVVFYGHYNISIYECDTNSNKMLRRYSRKINESIKEEFIK
jgi:hypothetical protein